MDSININAPERQNTRDEENSFGVVIGVIIAVLVVILLFIYGLGGWNQVGSPAGEDEAVELDLNAPENINEPPIGGGVEAI